MDKGCFVFARCKDFESARWYFLSRERVLQWWFYPLRWSWSPSSYIGTVDFLSFLHQCCPILILDFWKYQYRTAELQWCPEPALCKKSQFKPCRAQLRTGWVTSRPSPGYPTDQDKISQPALTGFPASQIPQKSSSLVHITNILLTKLVRSRRDGYKLVSFAKKNLANIQLSWLHAWTVLDQ